MVQPVTATFQFGQTPQKINDDTGCLPTDLSQMVLDYLSTTDLLAQEPEARNAEVAEVFAPLAHTDFSLFLRHKTYQNIRTIADLTDILSCSKEILHDTSLLHTLEKTTKSSGLNPQSLRNWTIRVSRQFTEDLKQIVKRVHQEAGFIFPQELALTFEENPDTPSTLRNPLLMETLSRCRPLHASTMTHLNLSNLHVSSFQSSVLSSSGLVNPQQIRSLDLSHNHLRTIPASLRHHFPQLRRIDLSSNAIVYLLPYFKMLAMEKHFESVDLRNNALPELPMDRFPDGWMLSKRYQIQEALKWLQQQPRPLNHPTLHFHRQINPLL